MSLFGVFVSRIKSKSKHENADRLELAEIEGFTYQFVIEKDKYEVGDDVIYFPVDTLLPTNLMDKLGLTGRLAGVEKNRVKTIKLRGTVSQGIVARPDILDPQDRETLMGLSPSVLAHRLGVTKYDPPPIICQSGNLVRMPDGVSVYDIEGAEANPDVVQLLMDEPVYVSEKLEGQNFWMSCLGDSVEVGQHHYAIQPIEGCIHTFWQIATDSKLIDLAKILASGAFKGKRVTLRGELCGPGIQKNIYGLKDMQVFLFDILVDCNYLPVEDFFKYLGWDGKSTCTFPTVPVLAKNVTLREWLAGKDLRQASNGISVLAKVAREGVVIKPMTEKRHGTLGRLVIKQRSPEYLAKTDF